MCWQAPNKTDCYFGFDYSREIGILASSLYTDIITARIRRMGEGTGGGGGYPIPGLVRGGTPSQVWPGGVSGVPPHDQVWMGYPPDLGWGTPRTWNGVPPRPEMGYPPEPGMGYPPRPGMGYPPSIASTCYAAGGMPLAFTQEDFLVFFCINKCLNKTSFCKYEDLNQPLGTLTVIHLSMRIIICFIIYYNSICTSCQRN